ncbi:MAG TPA: hypothetical protein VJ722_06920 [Rhodanobacteraceae bacterium]|nr:hypothetical protein [Rhodanobacteraceae bacterium]
MKRFISLLTVLCATGLPMTAAALDYGTDQRFLAAEAGAPSLPGAREDNPFAAMASHRTRADQEDTQSSPNAEPDPHANAARATAHRKPVPPSTAPGPGTAPPQHGQTVLSWQSLLPGSIQ